MVSVQIYSQHNQIPIQSPSGKPSSSSSSTSRHALLSSFVFIFSVYIIWVFFLAFLINTYLSCFGIKRSRIGDFLLKLYFWLKVKFWVYIECVYMEAGAEKSMPKQVSDDQALGSYALQSPPPPLLAEKLPTVCFMSCFFF